jgi:hypothetical protein
VRLCESAGVDPLWIGGRSKKWIEIVRVNTKIIDGLGFNPRLKHIFVHGSLPS